MKNDLAAQTAKLVELPGFLESENSGGLETELVSVLRGDFSDESLEISDEELGGLPET